MPRSLSPRMRSLSTLSILTLGLLLLGGAPTAHAQTPVVEAANSSDETVLQVNDDGGFVIPGEYGVGTIPVEGGGTRLMWYPKKGAFRAGHVFDTGWDDANVGNYSVALGRDVLASGVSSVALGKRVVASGENAVALGGSNYTSDPATAEGESAFAAGLKAQASGNFSIALGGTNKTSQGPTASGVGSFATGQTSTASGDYSVAIGATDRTTTAATASAERAIAIGNSDAVAEHSASMAFSAGQSVTTGAGGQMAFGANHFWFGDDGGTASYDTGRLIETSTGAYLSDGGDWTNSSDSTKKELYRPVDGEALLGALRDIPIRTWSYKAEPDSVRHMGPTAQDFHAAFGLGNSDKAISTVDMGGVNMRAIQALEARTTELQQENDALRATVATLEARMAALESQHGSRALAGLGYAPVVLAGLLLLSGLLLWRRREHAA